MPRIFASVSSHAFISCAHVASGSWRYSSPRSTGRFGSVRIEHVMERQVLDVLARDLRHPRRPPAVAPRDQPNRRIRRAAWPWRTRRSCARRSRGRSRSCRKRSRSRSANTGRRAAPPLRVPAVPHCPDLAVGTHVGRFLRVGGADARSLTFMYCRRPSDSKLTHTSGSAPTSRQKPTNSPVPTWFDSMPPQSRLTSGGRALRGPTPSRHR